MKKRYIQILVVLVLVLSLTANVYAGESYVEENRSVGLPAITVIGNTAKCKATVNYQGLYINATLELWQGNTLVASWTNSGMDSVTVSGNATIIHGLTYTLTVSGTAGGVEFTPRSITRTL